MPRPGRLWIAVDIRLLNDNRWDLEELEVLAYLKLLAYSREHDTDGIVPLRVAKRRCGPALQALLDAELITRGSRHIHISDWEKWNETREAREAKRAEWRQRQRRHRAHLALRTEEQEQELTTRDTDKRVTHADVTQMSRVTYPPPAGTDQPSQIARWYDDMENP